MSVQPPVDTFSGFIGRTEDGERVFVTIELRHREEPRQTVTHDAVERYTELSISAETYAPGRALTGDIASGGQIVETVADVATFGTVAEGLDAEDLDALVGLWDRWHLNGLRAGCAHQPTGADLPWMPTRYGRTIQLDAIDECPAVVLSDMPVTAEDYRPAYRYGTAHLVEILPWDVESRIRAIGARLAAVDTEQAEDEVETITYEQAEDQYEEWISSGYGEVEVAGMTFDAGRIIREMDPIAFRCGLNDWADAEGIEIG